MTAGYVICYLSLFTIYKAKPVGSPFGQMVSDIKFCHGIAFTIGTNEFHLPKNGREGLTRDAISQVEHEFPFGTFRPENRTIPL